MKRTDSTATQAPRRGGGKTAHAASGKGGRPLLHVSKAHLCELFQVSAQAVDNWVRHGCPRVAAGARGAEAVFDLAEVLPWYRRWKDGSNNRNDLDAARTQLTLEQREKTALEVARLRGELVPKEDLDRVLEYFVTSARAKFRTLPRRAAPKIVSPERVHDAESELERQVDAVLAELADDDTVPEFLEADGDRVDREGEAGVATAAEDLGEPVGGPTRPPA